MFASSLLSKSSPAKLIGSSSQRLHHRAPPSLESVKRAASLMTSGVFLILSEPVRHMSPLPWRQKSRIIYAPP